MSAQFGNVILAGEGEVDALGITSSRSVDTLVPTGGSTIMFGRSVRSLPAVSFAAHRYCTAWSEAFGALMAPCSLPGRADLAVDGVALESAALVNASSTLNGLCVSTVYNFLGS